MTQGAGAAQVDLRPLENRTLFPGYYGGIFLTYRSQPYVGVQLEANLARKGWFSLLAPGQSYLRRFDYFEVPFTTQIILGQKKLKYLIDIGPFAAWLLADSETINISDVTIRKDFIAKPVDQSFDFGFILKAGLRYPAKIGYFGVQAGISRSLINVFQATETFTYYSSPNQVIFLRANYGIRVLNR